MLTQGCCRSDCRARNSALRETIVRSSSPASGRDHDLTEPQAGSDSERARRVPSRQATTRIVCRGQKMFISYGEHDFTDNIVHLVLARLPGAPAGTKGISLFVVPKLVARPMAARGAQRRPCTGIEHKLGIHASPTCSMLRRPRGRVGWLIGSANDGLACMFTMMNAGAALVGIAGRRRSRSERSSWRRMRKSPGRAATRRARQRPIIEHADVRRMLLHHEALDAGAPGGRPRPRQSD